MGYSYSVYAVDLARLKKVWGSKDPKLAAAAKKQQAERIKDNGEWFADEIASGELPSLGQAIDEIVAGKVTKKQHGSQYGYALEVLCMHLGTRVDEEEFTWFDEFLDPLLKQAKQPDTEKLVGRGSIPMKIPEPADFPEIGTIDTKGIAAFTKALDAIEELAEDDDDAEEVIDEVRGWLAGAKKKRRQLVWFIY